MLEMRPVSAGLTSRGIIESLKTMENSAATVASTIIAMAKTRLLPGAAFQRARSERIFMTAKAAIQGFRAPEASAMEPMIGARSAMTMPAMVSV